MILDDLGEPVYSLKRFGGAVATVIPLTFGRARITISRHSVSCYDDLF